jgi:hypothetical protein
MTCAFKEWFENDLNGNVTIDSGEIISSSGYFSFYFAAPLADKKDITRGSSIGTGTIPWLRHGTRYFFFLSGIICDCDCPDLSVIYNPVHWCYDPETFFDER